MNALALLSLLLPLALSAWVDHYTDNCTCGVSSKKNNCAHFASNAMILSGVTDLDKGEGEANKYRGRMYVCSHGRPKMAKQLRRYAKNHYEQLRDSRVKAAGSRRWRYGQMELNCVVYQGGRKRIQVDGEWKTITPPYGGHIALVYANSTDFITAGTAWYSIYPIQEYYCTITVPEELKKERANRPKTKSIFEKYFGTLRRLRHWN